MLYPRQLGVGGRSAHVAVRAEGVAASVRGEHVLRESEDCAADVGVVLYETKHEEEGYEKASVTSGVERLSGEVQ